jgi:transcription antitermination factor NusG
VLSLTSISSPKWFAAYTVPRHEKQVSTRLQDRDVETFLPLYRSFRQWNNRTKANIELPLFPCYVFLRVASPEHGKVLSTPGVLSLVGSKREPWPLSDFEIETLRSGLHETNPEPHTEVFAGDQVRIRRGPLCGMVGVVLRIKNSLRVVLTLKEIGRSFSVEVNATDLEALCAKPGVSEAASPARTAAPACPVIAPARA